MIPPAGKRLPLTISAPAATAFFLVLGIGAFPQLKLHDPIPLLAERFIKGAGWIELLLLAVYAAWLVGILLKTPATDHIRRNAWTGFSIVFFTQAAIGLAGVTRFLMTGNLHLPIPAMIVAGPLFRGEPTLFMPILLSITLLVAGPAWCSWFCYMGAWDYNASRAKPAPGMAVKHPFIIRAIILAAVCVGAIVLRSAGVPTPVAAGTGILFGLAGIAIMVTISRRRGVMVHCTAWCPIGLIATIGGRINPFRIRIGQGCTRCHSCAEKCRYGALTHTTIRNRTPGLTCTLCGDCLSTCSGSHIGYRFPGLRGDTPKKVFMVIVVTIHVLFLGFGRI